MRKTALNAVYNARIPDELILRLLRIAGFSLLLLEGVTLVAGDWQAPAEQLARNIAAVTGTATVAVSVVNRSSLSSSDADQIQHELASDLDVLGVHSANKGQELFAVRVSLSENLLNYVWVAEIREAGRDPAVIIIETPRNSAAPSPEPATVAIHKALLWTSNNRILDVALRDVSPVRMIVLEPDHATIYALQNDHWQQQQRLAIEHWHPWPRDLRGRLRMRSDQGFDVYLPGVICQSELDTRVGLNCRDADDPWPIGADQFGLKGFFASSRNYFTDLLSASVERANALPRFYSIAAVPDDARTLVLLAAVDGQLHLLKGTADRTLTMPNWGSEIASVHSGCARGWQVLANSRSDGPNDSVQAFEMVDGQPVAASPPTVFDGRITALWTESEGTSVIAIAENLESTKYEAYRLSIICGL